MQPPIRVLIVDDEPLGRERVRQLLRPQPDMEIVGECEDGVEAVSTIRALVPDLVFLDVKMPELDGIGVLHALGPDRPPEVIFTTAHGDYMERAFEAHALDYLRKPYRESRFRDALHHARERINARRSVVPAADTRIQSLLTDILSQQPARAVSRLKIVEKDGEFRFIEPDTVYCLEANGNHIRVHTLSAEVTWRTTLTEAARQLDPHVFLRVHRSFIVNTSRIRRITRIGKGEYFLELDNGRKIGSGRSYREAIETFVNSK